MNHARTLMLLAALTALFGGVGYLIGGWIGMIIALVVVAAINGYSYWNADKVVLRMYRAQTVDGTHDDPRIRAFVSDIRTMAIAARMPVPQVAIVPQEQPNAFATGRDPEHAVLCATIGLLQLLTRAEVRGVMAHEMGHVRNRDTLTMTVTATIAGAVSMLANVGSFFGGDRDRRGGVIGTIALLILAPMAAGLVQMAISRGREYEADRAGADISQDPRALASALQKIESYSRRIANYEAERNPASAHLFIINPLSGAGADNLFSTHPNTMNRIRALLSMPGAQAQSTDDEQKSPAQSPTKPRKGPWG